MLDSRSGVGLTGKFNANTARLLPVAGRLGIPNDAVAITGNLTVVGQTKPGYVSMTPTLDNNPSTSVLNFPLGDTRANNITSPLSSGKVSIVYKALTGAKTDILLDVTGYFLENNSGATYKTVTPVRLLDSRSGNGGSQVWAPIAFDPKTAPKRDARYFTAIGRLKSGATIEDTQSEMSVLAARLAREYPDANRDHGVRVYTLTRGMMDEGIGPMFSLWQASAIIVLLIACANIANLLLARAAERRHETGVRLALGASRSRIVRESLTESALLALIAVPPALGFAWLSLYAIRVSMPANILRFVPGFESLGPDLRLSASRSPSPSLTACVFGLLPACQSARSSVTETLKEGGRTSTGRQRLRRAIVVAEISIALPLLVAAGLGVLGTRRFLTGPQGYDPDGLLTMKLVLPDRVYPDDVSRRQFAAKAVDALHRIAGVEYAAAVNNMPTSGSNASRTIEVEGHPAPDPVNLPSVDFRTVTAEYFSALRIPVLRGRTFTSADREDTAAGRHRVGLHGEEVLAE